jgi:hypothetical protein
MTAGLPISRPPLPLLLATLLLASTAGWCAAQTVTITAPDGTASEAGSYGGMFRLNRTGGDLSQPLVVRLSLGGTATVGADYETLPATVILPAGASSLDLPLDPINDAVAEADALETVVATVAPDPAYTVGLPASAIITIAEDETLATSAPFLHTVESLDATSLTLRWLDLFETETRYRIQYRAEGATAWTTIDNLPANTTTHTITGLVTGQAYESRVVAFQNTTSSLTPNPVRGVPLPPDPAAPAFSTFEEWRGFSGLAGRLRGTAGGAGHDPDGDGRSNLWEYLLGGNPLLPDRTGLALAPVPSGIALAWPENPSLLDVGSGLEERTAPGGWQASALSSTNTSGVRQALDQRGGATRLYRLTSVPRVPTVSAPLITCWGDSLTGNPGTYATKLPALLPGNRSVQNCGIGGDTSLQIAERMAGLTITSPYPAQSASTPAGTPVRIVASRTTHARIMSTSHRSNWAAFSATLANVSKVEFFNRGVKIGESSTPLAASVTSNRAVNASRLLAPGHPFVNGDVVQFPAGPLPSPLVVGKTYFVRDADAGGFSIVEADVAFTVTASSPAPSTRFVSSGHPLANGDTVWFRRGAAPPGLFAGRLYHVRDVDSGAFSVAATPGGPALSMVYDYTGAVMGKPGLTAVSLGADFAGSTAVQGPFVFDWIHPGGATSLSLRTHTDRDANTFILWMGRNNNARPHEVYADIRAAVRHIKALDARFLIVSVTNGGGESLGNQYYVGTVNLNHLLRLEFPDNFVDVRAALLRNASPDANDQVDRAADIPPRSLRSDNVHLNDAGQQVVAEVLAGEILERGW